MFDSPTETLKTREGVLLERPLPQLLHAILVEELTCALTLTRRQLSKTVLFEEGVPVACASNLLHETLGRFLVEKGKLSEPDYQVVLGESVQSGVELSELLLKKSLLSPFELYKQLQASLAHSLLDCFRWVDARYQLFLDSPPAKSPVRMNAVQLILTGVSLLPFDTITTQMRFVAEQRFAAVATPVHPLEELKLPTKDMRLLQVLRARPTFAELTQKTGLATEPLMRRLYAFAVLGLVDFAEAAPPVAAPVPMTPLPVPVKVPAAPIPAAVSKPAPTPPPTVEGFFADDDNLLKNELTRVFMEIRSRDPFDLLEVPENVSIAALRKAFLTVAARLSPLRFRTPDLHEKAEGVLLAHARAFAELSNPEQAELWRRRRRAPTATKAPSPSSHAAKMEIKTDLLDASVQMEKGQKLLAQKDFKGALTFFEYACEIEPKALHLASCAWARYLLNPGHHKKLARQELESALETDPECDVAFFFLGEIHRLSGEHKEAEGAYRRAFKISPGQRRYSELIKSTVDAQKR